MGPPGPSLSDLPVELLDIILSQLSDHRYGKRILFKLLLLNKRISSVAVKHLYQNPKLFVKYGIIPRQLFDTLLSSAINGLTYYPYYVYIEEFVVRDWWPMFETPGPRLELLDKIMECKNLRSLGIEIPEDVLILTAFPKCDITALKGLSLVVKGNLVDAKELVWMKEMTSRMRLESLEITMEARTSVEFLELQGNTLSSVSVTSCSFCSPRVLAGFIQTLLRSHSQSLTSISVSYAYFNIVSPLSLPNLQNIRVSHSQVAGWENICTSLKSLNDLRFDRVTISGTPPFVPDPGQLEMLVIDMAYESAELAVTWIDDNYKSFSKLRILRAPRISAEPLAYILDKCSDLVDLSCHYTVDENLKIISRLAPASLQSLHLFKGRFTPDGLSAFVAAFPPSITRLKLSEFEVPSPSNFRLLLQLPSLRHLDVSEMRVSLEERIELKNIAANERSSGLLVNCGL